MRKKQLIDESAHAFLKSYDELAERANIDETSKVRNWR